jgi:hypothetical protein
VLFPGGLVNAPIRQGAHYSHGRGPIKHERDVNLPPWPGLVRVAFARVEGDAFMITMLFRFIALFLIISALMLLGADAISTIEGGGVVKLRSMGDVLTLFAPSLAPVASGPLAPVLGLPGWALLGALGLILAFVFRYRPEDEFDS